MKTVLFLLLALPLCIFAQIDFSTHLNRLNQLRAQNGVGPLVIDGRLNSCAQAHAQDMNNVVGLSHTGSDGSQPGERIRRCVGQNDIYASENAGAGFSNDLSVLNSWYNSPGHRANMLSGDYSAVGIGRVGSYWVQNFAGGLRGGSQPQPAPQPRPQPQPQPQPQPRPESPAAQPRPQSPSPNAPQPAITTAPATTRARPTTTRVRVTRSNSPIPVPSFNPDQPLEEGILVENIPGIDSIVPADFNESIGDFSGATEDDIDDRLYAGSEEDRKKLLAEAAINDLSAEDKEALLKAKEIYGNEFNPFMLMTTSDAGKRFNFGSMALMVMLVAIGVLMI